MVQIPLSLSQCWDLPIPCCVKGVKQKHIQAMVDLAIQSRSKHPALSLVVHTIHREILSIEMVKWRKFLHLGELLLAVPLCRAETEKQYYRDNHAIYRELYPDIDAPELLS